MVLRSSAAPIRSNCRIKFVIKFVCDKIWSATTLFVLANRINIFMQLKLVVFSNSTVSKMKLKNITGRNLVDRFLTSIQNDRLT